MNENTKQCYRPYDKCEKSRWDFQGIDWLVAKWWTFEGKDTFSGSSVHIKMYIRGTVFNVPREACISV